MVTGTPLSKNLLARKGVGDDVGLGRLGHVPRDGERASHHHDAANARHRLGVLPYGSRDVGERARGHNREVSPVAPGCVKDELYTRANSI